MAGSFFACEIASELVKRLFEISAQIIQCKGTAENIIELIKNIQPMIIEIQTSGVELSAHRQAQIRMILEILEKGKKLTEEVLKSSRFDIVRKAALVKKMEKLEKQVTSFFDGLILTNILADIHRLRGNFEVRLDRVDKILDRMNEQLGSMKTEEEEKRAGTMKKPIVIESIPGSWDEFMVGLELAKMQVKEMMFKGQGGVFGITGMAGIGKTALVREIERDDEVRCHYDHIWFQTVSQYPNIEEIMTHMSSFYSGCEPVNPYHNLRNSGFIRPKLMILDDVWTRETLDSLTSFKIPGLTTLVSSRFELTGPEFTYEIEPLSIYDAESLLCYSAFGQNSIPDGFCGNLVRQVANECKGLPLTLKTLGASLKGKPETDWEGALQKLSRGETC